MPNQEKATLFEDKKANFSRFKPWLDMPVVILQNEKSISYSETLITYFVQESKNIISLGSPTAGANGDVNYIKIRDNYITFSQAFAVDNNDNCYFSTGLKPTIFCEENEIEKAIEWIKTCQ